MKFLFACLAVVLSLSTMGAEEPALEVSRADEQILFVLPEASRHHFVAVNPAWRQEVDFMRLRPDSFLSIDHPSDREKASLYKGVRYFADAAQGSQAVKSLIFYPGGKLHREIDSTDDETFCRHFFADGSFMDFTYWHKGRWIAGVAVDPQTKQENHFSEGAGSLTTCPEGHVPRTAWYHDGKIFLQVDREDHRRTEIRLDILGDGTEWDCLIANCTKEKMTLSTHEIWTHQAGGGVSFNSIMSFDGSDQYHGDVPRQRMFGSGRPEEKIEEQQIFAAWKSIYNDKRRPDFMKRYSDVLAAAGQSWESLHIEFIRDGAPWPDR